jgi:antitoxin component YwqK of YwqJK toxin-antitoxin module
MLKKCTLTLAIGCMAVASYAQSKTDTIRRKDADGWEYQQVVSEKVVIVEGYLHNKKKAGVWNEYWLNQYPRTMCAYMNGKKHGTSIGMTATGTMSYIENYKNGELDGPRKVYNTNNTGLMEEEYYSDGKKHGNYRYWYQNGKLKEEGRYVHGVRDGVTIIYYENGSKSAEFTYKNGQLDGEASSNYADGKVKDAGFYSKGIQNGQWREYYINGNMQADGEYKNGEKEGPWKQYDVLGKYMKTIEYKNGEEVH